VAAFGRVWPQTRSVTLRKAKETRRFPDARSKPSSGTSTPRTREGPAGVSCPSGAIPTSQRPQHSCRSVPRPSHGRNARMIERITTDPDLLGECPVWDSASEVLWWTDIEGRTIRRYAPGPGTLESCELGYRPGSLALTSQPDRLLVAMEHQVGWFDWVTGSWEPWRDLEPGGTGNRLNDGRCDPAGRFWVGSMFERSAEGRCTGLLHRVEASGV